MSGAAREAREDAIVREVLKDRDGVGPIRVRMLGAKHDLTDNLQRLNLKDVEYLRATVMNH